MAYAIYGLDTIGVDGAYEADGEVHWYCSELCANNHAIAEGFRTSANYSKPQAASEQDMADGTECEWCGKEIEQSKAAS